ncbi:hypothetical protein [Maribacter sp. 2308TA10-17]|uniref:hypothetical protein n=1 Tax=Maribacter sp. 2308TA10-17 TaxID=3386276 RepID=UPI0039BC974C
MKTFHKQSLISLFTVLMFYSCKVEEKNTQEVFVLLEGEFEDVEAFDESELELSSNIIFDGTKRWQLVASSQNYQTNYAVYAKFVLDENESNENIVSIKKVSLKILNYKSSPVELGIKDFEIEQGEAFDKLKVKIYLKGYSRKRIMSKRYENLIKVGNNSIVTSERYLEPIFEVTSKRELADPKLPKYEYITKSDTSYYKPFGYFYTGFSSDMPKDSIKVFDSEFFYKDGVYIVVKPNYDAEIEKNIINDNMAPGFRCKTARFVGKIQLGS